MAFVEIGGGRIADGAYFTPNEKRTFEHFLKEEIEREFKRMSLREIKDIVNDYMESPSLFVVEVIGNTVAYTINTNEENEEEVCMILERRYYDFCIDYFKKLALAKYGNKLELRGYNVRKCCLKNKSVAKRDEFPKVNVGKMF